jgi:hypothetical protein
MNKVDAQYEADVRRFVVLRDGAAAKCSAKNALELKNAPVGGIIPLIYYKRMTLLIKPIIRLGYMVVGHRTLSNSPLGWIMCRSCGVRETCRVHS